MAKKKKPSKKSHEAPYLEEFEESPFSSPTMVTIHFRDGKPLRVHASVIAPYPFLSKTLYCTEEENFRPPDDTLSTSLNHISHATGHILTHYLYSNTYPPTKWTGQSIPYAAIFKRSLEVYATARTFQMLHLESLAKEKVAWASDGLEVSTILGIIAESHSFLKGDDAWLQEFIKAVVGRAFAKFVETGGGGIDDDDDDGGGGNAIDSDAQLAMMVVQSVFEVFREKVEELGGSRGKHPLIVDEEEQAVERVEDDVRKEEPSSKTVAEGPFAWGFGLGEIREPVQHSVP